MYSTFIPSPLFRDRRLGGPRKSGHIAVGALVPLALFALCFIIRYVHTNRAGGHRHKYSGSQTADSKQSMTFNDNYKTMLTV